MRAGKSRGIARLDELKRALDYLPLSTEIMLQAARFWAQARQQGRPTAGDTALDADVILAAQASVLAAETGDQVIVATTNVGHLSLFVDARRWSEIT